MGKTMGMTHTPGPWKHEGNGDVVSETRWIAACGTPAEGLECEANARLIATAPKLLTAAEAVLEDIRPWHTALQWRHRPQAIRDLENAVAEARGERP